MNAIDRLLHRPFFIKLLHWEYWSFNTVYLPIIFIWVWLSLRARSFFFFSAANPTIYNGGFLMESKWAIYQLIPPQWYPKTIFFKAGVPACEIMQELNAKGFRLPLIGKPDIGGKGRGVRKLNNEQQVEQYSIDSRLDFLIQ